jgi:hypothetical protein
MAFVMNTGDAPARTMAGVLLLLLLVSVTTSLSEAQSDECFGDAFYNCYVAGDKFENVQSQQRCCEVARADKDCACLWAFSGTIHENLPIQVWSCAVDSCGGTD